MAIQSEVELYEPVKRFLEARGYGVKGEVNGCDLVAMRDGEIIIVELKPSFNLALVFQGIERQKLTDRVYLAIETPRRVFGSRWNDVRALCRRLGLGLLTVTFTERNPVVNVVAEPEPAPPRRNPRKRAGLLSEFGARSGDHNTGGINRRPLVTAYRESALHVARCLKDQGLSSPAELKERSGVDKAPSMVQKNVYGWFQRVERGLYGLSAVGEEALEKYADVVGASNHRRDAEDAEGGG